LQLKTQLKQSFSFFVDVVIYFVILDKFELYMLFSHKVVHIENGIAVETFCFMHSLIFSKIAELLVVDH
jgi:hypothetical protein